MFLEKGYFWLPGSKGSAPGKDSAFLFIPHSCFMLICIFGRRVFAQHLHRIYFIFWWYFLTPLATLTGVFLIVLLGRELPTLFVLSTSCQNPAPRCSPRCYPSVLTQRYLWAHVHSGQATANTSLVLPAFQHPSAALWAALLPGTAVSLLSDWCWPKLPCFSLEDVASLKWKYFVSICLLNTPAAKPWYDSNSGWSIWLQQCILWCL